MVRICHGNFMVRLFFCPLFQMYREKPGASTITRSSGNSLMIPEGLNLEMEIKTERRCTGVSLSKQMLSKQIVPENLLIQISLLTWPGKVLSQTPKTKKEAHRYTSGTGRRAGHGHGPESRHSLSASMTVETAVVLPLIICLMVTVIFMMKVLVIQHAVGQSMDETIRERALYGKNLQLGSGNESNGGDSSKSVGIRTKGILIARCLQKIQSRGNLPSEHILGGIVGINLLGTEVSDTEIHMKAMYYIRLPVPIFHVKGIPIVQTASTRRWVGWNPEMEKNEKSEPVFITPSGKAYHPSRSCTYLNIKIEETSKTAVRFQRSRDGSKYYACPFCKSEKNGGYYITSYGNRYHRKRNCPAIKRSIRETTRRDAEKQGYHRCGKCG